MAISKGIKTTPGTSKYLGSITPYYLLTLIYKSSSTENNKEERNEK